MNVNSITEQGDLDEFLSTAALADIKFVSEKMDHQMVLGPNSAVAKPSYTNVSDAALRSEIKKMLRIPRRYFHEEIFILLINFL